MRQPLGKVAVAIARLGARVGLDETKVLKTIFRGEVVYRGD
jgi:hypothetical protein